MVQLVVPLLGGVVAAAAWPGIFGPGARRSPPQAWLYCFQSGRSAARHGKPGAGACRPRHVRGERGGGAKVGGCSRAEIRQVRAVFRGWWVGVVVSRVGQACIGNSLAGHNGGPAA